MEAKLAAPVTRDAPTKRRRRSGFASSPRYSGLNDRMATVLSLLVLIIAVPMASNRPIWWLVWGIVIGGLACIYLWRSRRIDRARRLQIQSYRVLFGVALLVPVFALLQALPYAQFLPAGLTALPAALQGIKPPALSVLPDASVLGALRAMTYLTFLFLVIEVATRPSRTSRMMKILFFGMVLHAIYALIALNLLGDFVFWGPKRAYLGAATGTFVNRNSFATFLGFGLILGVAIIFERRAAPKGRVARKPHLLSPENLEAVFYGLMIAVVALALLATQSRMGAFASLLGLLTTFTLLRRNGGASIGRLAAEIGVTLVVLGVFFVGMGGDTLQRLLFLETDSGTRLDLYRQTWAMITVRPLSGFGYDSFAAAFELFRQPPLLSERDVDLAHNTYLTLWAEQGLIIGSLPPLLLLAMGWLILRNQSKDKDKQAISAAALGVMVLGAVHSTVDFSLEIPANVVLFIAVIGMALPNRRLKAPAESKSA